MMQVTLHKTPRSRDVVLEQFRVVGLGLRREMQVAALVIGIVTIMVTIAVVRGEARTWFDSDEWMPFALASFLLPFAVWRRDKRFGAGFLWTLPVDRRRLALARVFAGWAWLMIVLAVFFAWQSVLAIAAGVVRAQTVSALVIPGSTAMYLFGSAVVLGLRHPLRWLFGVAGVSALLPYVNEGLDDQLDPFFNSRAVISAVERGLPLIFVLWLAASFVALWAAVSRHSERRRP